MENKIPTAEDFAKEYHDGAKWSTIMCDFAKLHVQEALKTVYNKIELDFIPYDEEEWSQQSITREDILDFYDPALEDVDYSYEQLRNRDGFVIEANKDSILNCYPDSNIK